MGGGCVRGGDTNSRPSAWPWLQFTAERRSKKPVDSQQGQRGIGPRGAPRPARQTRLHPETRPGVLLDPEPQVAGKVAAAAPLFVQPVLGGGDTLDTVAVQFLLA